MKIILSGGWNNRSEDSTKNCCLYRHKDHIMCDLKEGKMIAIVNLAKIAGHYDSLIRSIYGKNIDIIEENCESVKWDEYDGLYFLGGTAATLKNNLLKYGFSLKSIKSSATLLGDSAGAYVLSSYFYNSPPGEKRGVEIDFVEGFNQNSGVITIAHKNNPFYCNNLLMNKVHNFASQNNLSVIELNENEEFELAI